MKPEVGPEVDLEGANKLWAYKKLASYGGGPIMGL